MRNDTESGTGRINIANQANNTALHHAASLGDAIANLNNGNSYGMNDIINSGSQSKLIPQGLIPGAVDKADAVAQFVEKRNAVSNELEKSFHGAGTTAEQAVKRQIEAKH